MPAYPPHCSQPGCELLELITCALQPQEQKERASRGDLLKGIKLGGGEVGLTHKCKSRTPSQERRWRPTRRKPQASGTRKQGGPTGSAGLSLVPRSPTLAPGGWVPLLKQ